MFLKGFIGLSFILVVGVLPTVSADAGGEIESPYSYGAKGVIGHLWAHTNKLEPFKGLRPRGVEVFAHQSLYGDESWQEAFNYPDRGLKVQLMDIPDESFGYALSTTFFLDYYIFRGSKNDLSASLGTGLSYVRNPYDPEQNPENEVIGSSLNMNMDGQISHHFHLDNNWTFRHGIGLTHISNGDYVLPNRGINVPNYQMGVYYQPKPSPEGFKRHDLPSEPQDRYFFMANLSAAYNETSEDEGSFYPAYTVSLQAYRKFNNHSILVGGFDGFFNEALRYEVESNFDEESRPDFRRAGGFLGHELKTKNLSLFKHFGHYFYHPYEAPYSIYQRYGLRYYFGEHFTARFALKAHLGRADVLDVGVGLKF